MSAYTVDRLHLAVLDGHLMDDATLARLVPECRSLTAFTTMANKPGLAERWAAIAPETELIDGGHVADLREAMVECAKRRIVVICTGVPDDAATFVALALQGAAAMTEFEVAGVAVHVMRPVERTGSVAWLTDTGELSGYGVLFAVGYAHLHGTGLDLIEPTGGLDRPRTVEALDDALAFAEAAGVPITRHTDPSPFARVLRDEHCLVVHPVLDAPKGFNLLHPGELSHKAVASGNPAVVVELLEQFPGDVVAVFDGVHLLSGSIPAARIAAGVALGVVAAAGIGTMVASPAMAESQSSSSQHVHGNSVDVDGHVAGVSWVATPHSHGETTLTLRNTTGQDIAVRLVAGHGHEGGSAGSRVVVVPAHEFTSVTLGGGVKQWTLSPGTTQQSTPTHQTTHVVVGDESDLIVTSSQGPGALVDEKDPTTQLQPNAPQVTPQVPQAVPQGVPVPVQQVAEPMLVPQVPTEVAPQQGPEAVPGPEQKVDAPVLVPSLPEQGTPVAVPDPQAPGPEQQVAEPMLVPQVPEQVAPQQGPEAVPGPEQKVDAPVLVPSLPEQGTPVAVPDPQAPGPEQKVAEPMLVPQVPTEVAPQQGPEAVPGPEQKVDAPVLVPSLPEQGTPVAVPNPQAPGPEQKVDEPMLVPPLRGTIDEITQSAVDGVVTSTESPGGVVDVGQVVTPGVTSEVTTAVTTETGSPVLPGTTTTPTTDTGVTTTGGHGPTTPATHHHTSLTGVTDGTGGLDHHAPAGELAHTGGNTAILAIVAGSLLAAGAGLAVAGRMGKDDPDTGVTEG